jgi:hypothetical protein
VLVIRAMVYWAKFLGISRCDGRDMPTVAPMSELPQSGK